MSTLRSGLKSGIKMRFGLVLANDITEPHKAIEVAENVAPFVDGIKVGITTVLEEGLSTLKKIKNITGKIVMADFKVADIGFWNSKKMAWNGTNAKIIEKTIEAGADYVICHSIVGISSIQECVEVAHSMGGKVLTLPYMTHKGAELFFFFFLLPEHAFKVISDYGIEVKESELRKCKSISDAIILLGEKIGVDGYIGPANKFDILKRYRELTEKPIFGSGIGRQAIGGITPKEQLRKFYEICGEKSAAIVGSAIYAAEDPRKAAEEFRKWRDEGSCQV